MALPYQQATSGPKALEELRKILTGFGCTKFGTMTDTELADITVQFEYRGRYVQVKASARGYAAAMLKGISRPTARQQQRAIAQGHIAVNSILRDWVKGQVTAIETGILTFEGAFLGQILLPSGKTVLEMVETQNLLPAPAEDKVTHLPAKGKS